RGGPWDRGGRFGEPVGHARIVELQSPARVCYGLEEAATPQLRVVEKMSGVLDWEEHVTAREAAVAQLGLGVPGVKGADGRVYLLPVAESKRRVEPALVADPIHCDALGGHRNGLGRR